MELEHHVTVPVSIEATWALFNDPERVARCFPGATLSSVDGDELTGSVKIRLGPIALQYDGVGTYVERNQAAHRAVIEANGTDRRGNGTANARVTAQLTADGEGTAVHVTTELAVSGKPAQFGRGVLQDAGDKLLLQLVACLQTTLETPEAAAPAEGQAGRVGAVATPAADAPPHVSAAAPAPAADPEVNLLRTVGPVLLTRYAARALGPLAFVVGYLLGRRSRRRPEPDRGHCLP